MLPNIEDLSGRVVPEDEVNWNVVRLIVEKYTERHPEEVRGCAIHVEQLKKDLKTKYAELEVESRARHIFELPTNLEMALTMKYPKVLKDENLRQFLGMFPMFQVAETL